jgi:hypothetical protein
MILQVRLIYIQNYPACLTDTGIGQKLKSDAAAMSRDRGHFTV